MAYCESSLNHVALLKKAVEVPFKRLLHAPSPRLHIEEISELCEDGSNTRRVFVHNDEHDAFAEVGWVHNEEVMACLSCHLDFGFFRWKHHCRTCGNLVCINCTAPGIIQSHLGMGQQIVCTACFSKCTSMGVPSTCEKAWGQAVYRSSTNVIHRDFDEVRAAPLTYQCEASPGFVIQTHRAGNSLESVYINVIHHDSIRDFYSALTHVTRKARSVSKETQLVLSLMLPDSDNETVAIDLDALVRDAHFDFQPELEKVTPLVYVYGPCNVQEEVGGRSHFLYNVLVSSTYFDEDFIKDSAVLITHGTSVNKIIQIVNQNFDEQLETSRFSLPTLARGYMGGVPPADVSYARSSCSVPCIPETELFYRPTVAFPGFIPFSNSNKSDTTRASCSFGPSHSSKSELSSLSSSGRGSGGSLQNDDGFSERITRNYSDELKAQSVTSPDTLLRCEIVYPYNPSQSAAYSSVYVITDHKHTPFRGTMFQLWSLHTEKKKWVKLKRGIKGSGTDFYVTRKFLGSAKEYRSMIQP